MKSYRCTCNQPSIKLSEIFSYKTSKRITKWMTLYLIPKKAKLRKMLISYCTNCMEVIEYKI